MAIMNAMPEHYIVTTTTYPPGSPMPSGRIRTEAATLEEARETALRIASKHEGNTWSPAKHTAHMARHAREQRAALVAMALYPILFAAVIFDALPYLRAMLEATP
jgi:hypothetical protein